MLDRTTPPSFAREFSFDLPSPEIISLPNGLKLFWLKSIQQDVIKLEFIYKAGKWHEPKAGIAYFTAHMLEKGTSELSSKKIAEILDRQGAQIEISSGTDFTSVAVYSLSKNIDKVIPVIFEVLQQSTFPEDELALMKSISIQNLKINNEKTSFVASRMIQRNIYGAAHPYGRSLEESDIDKINSSDLNLFFKNSFTPLEIYLTGNLSSSQLLALELGLTHQLLKNSQSIEIPIPTFHPSIEKISKEKSVQSTIRFGKLSIKKSNINYPGLLLLNHILGGYFGSRLMKNIREEKGLTYGIYSSINSHLNASSIVITADVNKDKTEITIKEIHHELRSLIVRLIPNKELEIAKNHLLGTLQLELSNPFSVVDKIKHLNLNHLSADYYLNLFLRVKIISNIELQIIASELLDPSSFNIIVVG